MIIPSKNVCSTRTARQMEQGIEKRKKKERGGDVEQGDEVGTARQKAEETNRNIWIQAISRGIPPCANSVVFFAQPPVNEKDVSIVNAGGSGPVIHREMFI